MCPQELPPNRPRHMVELSLKWTVSKHFLNLGHFFNNINVFMCRIFLSSIIDFSVESISFESPLVTELTPDTGTDRQRNLNNPWNSDGKFSNRET